MTHTEDNNLSQQEWSEKIRKDPMAVIIDVRTANECAEGIIEGAIMLDIMKDQNFISGLEKLNPSKSYYVYCRSGSRSGQACRQMNAMGFNRTYNLSGGMMQWAGKTINPNL